MASLFEQVRDRLERGITAGEYALGEVLPPVETLAERHGCSPGTVRRAMTELAQRGLVRSIQRKGTVVTARPPRGRVCLLLSGEEHMDLMFQRPVYEALHQANFQVDLVPGGLDAEALQMRLEALFASGSGIKPVLASIMAPPELLKEPWAHRLFAGRVIYSYYPEPMDPKAVMICPDLQQMARDVVEYLLRLGHRRIAVVAGFPGDRATWATATAEHARHLVEVAGGTFRPHYLGPGEYESLVRLIQEERVTAYWALHDHHALQVMAHLHRHGIRVPEDLALVGRNDTPWSRNGRPALTSVSLDPTATAAAIVRAVLAMVQNDTAPDAVSLVRPRLVVRDSTEATSTVGGA
ncbi:MAG: substrate-binding domain-containing protein [Phycisphaeraceae bacterium]